MAAKSSVLGGVVSSVSPSSSLLQSHSRRRSGEDNSTTAAALPNYLIQQSKIFKRNGVIVVLFWSLCSLFVFLFLTSPDENHVKHITVSISPTMLVAISVLFYPLLGWLADVHFTRYRVIKWCLRIMWLVSVLFCLLSLLLDYYDIPTTNESLYIALKYILYISLTLSLVGLQANIIQFGIDQLYDASSSEMSSFFGWYAWVWSLSGILVVPLQQCICKDHLKSLPLLLLPLLLTIAISLDFIFHSCLVKEPLSSNPLTLIFKVLQYAAKNKYPRLRSAFTYWDDKHFSRIDLGKSKYGGPFTTEEVEDVKTFWRMFGVIVVGCIFFGMFVSTYVINCRVLAHLQGGSGISCGISCFRGRFYQYFGGFILVVFLPVYEFLLHPFFRKYFYVSTLTKCLTGVIFFLLSLIGYLIIEGVGHYLLQNPPSSLTCPKDGPSNVTLPLNQMWIMFPGFLNNIAQFFCIFGATEFICAQSPYSMKGLMFGVTYGCIGVFSVLSFVLLLPVQYAIKKWLPPRYGCEMWYLLFIFLFLLVTICIFSCFHKFYKRRSRDDELHNEQMFAHSQGHT